MNLSVSQFLNVSASYFNDSLLRASRTLTEQQKKIIALALVAFCCLTICYQLFAPNLLEGKQVTEQMDEGFSLKDEVDSPEVIPQENIQKGEVIYFYVKGERYYELTNFYENWRPDGLHYVRYLGIDWKTSEHAFQAEKFNWSSLAAQDIRHEILNAHTSREAFQIAQKNKHLSRPDWHSIKDDIMLEILRCKFEDEHLSKVLRKTGSRDLVEASPIDAYWGYGSDGKGLNRLGTILMQVREERFGF